MIKKIIPAVFGLFLMIICVGGSPASDFTTVKTLAEKGDPKAQTALGKMYLYGNGVEVNCPEGIAQYQMAAKQGYLQAINNLGYEYLRGKCLPKDMDGAIKYLTEAADAGHMGAKNNLAALYKNGAGIKKNYPEAVKWYLQTAESMKGGPGVYNELGEIFEDSPTIGRNRQIAFQFYAVAAEAGVAQAMTNVGRFYLLGLGVEKDPAAAREWLEKALSKGDKNAERYLKTLNEKDTGKN